MRNRRHLPVDGGDDVGMGVPEQGAHLAGGEIEDGTVIRIINETPLGPLNNDLLEGRPITGEMSVGRRPEGRLLIQRCEVLRKIVHAEVPCV